MARLVFDNISGNTEEITLDASNPLVIVGRSADSHIRSNRKSVSRKHAEFHYLGEDGCEVVDLNSSNGIFILINGERQRVRGREYLSDGDEIWCGDYVLRFYDEQEEDVGSIATPFAETGAISAGPFAKVAPEFPGSIPIPQGVPKDDLLDRNNLTMDLRDTAMGAQIAPHPPFSVTGNEDAEHPMRISALEKELKENHIRESIINEELTLLKRENAKLRKMVNEQNDDNDATKLTLRDTLEGSSIDFWTQSNHSRVSSLKESVETLRSENEKLYAMLVEERTKRTEINETYESLALKMKNLQEEKTALEAEIAELTAERNRQKGRIKGLELKLMDMEHSLHSHQGTGNPLTPELMERLRRGEEATESVRLVVDAIGRADLRPLSTIDRVRLEGAIRDLNATASTEFLLQLIGDLKDLQNK